MLQKPGLTGNRIGVNGGRVCSPAVPRTFRGRRDWMYKRRDYCNGFVNECDASTRRDLSENNIRDDGGTAFVEVLKRKNYLQANFSLG